MNILPDKTKLEVHIDDFVSLETVVPFPRASDRLPWEELQKTPIGGRRSAYIQGLAEEMVLQEWPQLTADLWDDYERTGNRSSYEAPCFRRRQKLGVLALAECFQGEGVYLDEIIKGIDYILEETSWCSPSHAHRLNDNLTEWDAAKILGIFSCETAAVLAETVYLLETELTERSPTLVERVHSVIMERIIIPAEDEIDTYWWSDGRNNWAPWCASNILGAAMYTLKDRKRLTSLVTNCLLPVINNYIERYPADGACDEGPNYWNVGPGAMLIFLEHLQVLTGGSIDVYDDPFIKSMGEFAANAHMAGSWALNFADARPHFSLRPAVAYRFAERINSEPLKTVTQHFIRDWKPDGPVTPPLTRKFNGGDLIYMLRELFWLPDEEDVGEIVKPETVWYPHTQVMIARESTIADQGFILAAKGGHNGENHNHNDVGHFVLYRDGQPFIVDMGVGSYTAKTFSERRYEILTMRSIAHNIPTIEGIEQSAGPEFAASDVVFNDNGGERTLSMNLAKAYSEKSGIEKLQRVLCLKNKHISIEDRFTISTPKKIELNFYTPAVVEQRDKHLILRNGGAEIKMSFAGSASLQVDVQEEELADARLKSNWARESLTRITLKGTISPEAPDYTLLFS